MADKLVLMILSENYIEKKGHVWCSQKQLADQCLCTDRGLRGILDRLERFGLVGIVHQGRHGNYYSLPFMRNGVPQSVDAIEEGHAAIEERIEERHAHLEERARSSRTVDGIDGDGVAPSALVPCPECGKPKQFCKGHSRKKSAKQWGRRKERTDVQVEPKRSPAEERRARTAENIRAFERADHSNDFIGRILQARVPD